MDTLAPTERNALVLSSEEWHQGVVGIVASRLSEKFSCPSFMIHLAGGMGKGSCRSYGGFNLFAALEACSDLLIGFGGHELTAGFTIKEENIPAFRKRINQYVRTHCGDAAPVSSLAIDVALTRPSVITLQEVEELSRLEPYGAGNNRPVFCLRGARLESMQSVGQNKHLKLRLQKGHTSFDGIFFSVTPAECGLTVGERVDAAFYLQVNEFRGSRSLQLQLVDLRSAHDPGAREAEQLELCRTLIRGGGSLGIYFALFGFAAVFLFSGAHVLPTAKNNRGAVTRAWEQAEQALADKLPADFPVPARYAHPIVLRRMIRILREGRAQTAPEALEVLKADLKALNASVQVEQAEYDEVVAIKPMFLLHEYK